MEIRVKAILELVSLLGGHKEQQIELEAGSTARDLLTSLIALYGSQLQERLFESSDRLNQGIALLLNGRNIFALKGLETKLNHGDELLFFPPVAGG